MPVSVPSIRLRTVVLRTVVLRTVVPAGFGCVAVLLVMGCEARRSDSTEIEMGSVGRLRGAVGQSLSTPGEAGRGAHLKRKRIGCADGTREGFVDLARYPKIAGCSGAWEVPGVKFENPGQAPACAGVPTYDTTRPLCGRQSGNDGANRFGTGCTVEDLCAKGWHVCKSSAEVASSSPTGCVGVTMAGDPHYFFVTRQSGTGGGTCATGTRTGPACEVVGAQGCASSAWTSNDVFGCGNFATTTHSATCAPLDRFTDDHCLGLLAPWFPCGTPQSNCEAYIISKRDPGEGGVLCCKNAKRSRGGEDDDDEEDDDCHDGRAR